jgi:mannose-6-phosphate isomerase-like protein (cupin superfamily)
MSYIGNIHELTMRNDNFRRVVYTGDSQIVVMCIPVGTEVGEVVNENREQIYHVLSGICDIILDHKRNQVTGGDVIAVSPGVSCNIINTGEESVRLVAFNATPLYADSLVHITLQDSINQENA